MADMEKAAATQLANIEKRTGKTLKELGARVRASGLEKHGEQVAFLKRELGMGHGDANALAHHLRSPTPTASSSNDDPGALLYTGKKADLLPIHEKLLREIGKFGAFDVAPKKTYLSLRRKKQFAMIGPATQTEVEVGINVKDLPADERLSLQPPKTMCDYKVRLTTPAEVDKTLIAWLRRAFDAAG